MLSRPAGELASLIRAGELSARELVTQSLRRIDELEPVINAFTHIAGDTALAEAETIAPDDPRPFAGVPIAVKDNRPVAGMPLTMGSDLFGDFVARSDAFLVRRLRAAGFVIVGKTTMPEMGILPTTEPRRYGATANPWSLDRTPGGSSGGSAAAVAAGMVPVAHGNDGGGSIRIPAACCGLVGLKPARGRVSVGPAGGASFLASDGVLTRTVGETAQALDVLAGYELGDAYWAAPEPAGAFARAAERDPGPLRIGLTLVSALDEATLDPLHADAIRDASALLESLGHAVEEVPAPWAGIDLLPDFSRLFGAHLSMTTLIGAKLRRREPREDDVEPLTWTLWKLAQEQGAIDLLIAQDRIESASRAIVSALAPYDAVLTPALAQRPLRTGEVHGRGPDSWEHFRRSGYFTPYTAIANVTGLPAIALPMFHGEDGLPTAVQLIGRPAGEVGLLALAGQLERARPWAERRAEVEVARPRA